MKLIKICVLKNSIFRDTFYSLFDIIYPRSENSLIFANQLRRILLGKSVWFILIFFIF